MLNAAVMEKGGAVPVERRALHGVSAGVLSFGALLVQTALMVPLLLHYWGRELYGVWLGLAALTAFIGTIDTGHQAYVGNEFCRLYATNLPRFRKVLASSLRMALLLGIAQILLTGLLAVFGLFPWLLGVRPALVGEHNIAACLVVLVATWVFSGSLGGILTRLYLPAGLFSRSIWWGILVRLGQTLGIVTAVVAGGDLLAACLAGSLVTTVVVLLAIRDVCRVFRAYRPLSAGGEWRIARSTLARSLVLSGGGIMLQAQSSGMLLLLIYSLGAAAIPAFTTLRTLSNTFLQATAVLTTSLIPEMIRYHAQGDCRKLAEVFATSWWLGGILINAALLASLPFIEPVYLHWTGHQLAFERPLYLMLAWSVSLKNFGVPLNGYLSGINQLRGQSIIVTVQSAIVLGGTLAFVSRWGLGTASLALVAGEFAGSVLIPLRLVSEELRRLGGALPVAHAWAAGGSVILVGTVFTFVGLRLISPANAAAVGLPLLLALHAGQWSLLSPEVKSRLRNVTIRRSGQWFSRT